MAKNSTILSRLIFCLKKENKLDFDIIIKSNLVCLKL